MAYLKKKRYTGDRATWIKKGDKNTKYFHHKANQRKRRNSIKRIKSSNGGWLQDEKAIGEEAVNFFSNMFMASNTIHVEDVCSHIKRKLDPAQATLLSQPFTANDVEVALRQMGP